MAALRDREDEDHPTRSEVAQYIHDVTEQLVEMAERSGLGAAAAALKRAQLAIERDF
jgi:hypothetical protein